MKVLVLVLSLVIFTGCEKEKDEPQCIIYDVYTMKCGYENDWALDEDGIFDSNDDEFNVIWK